MDSNNNGLADNIENLGYLLNIALPWVFAFCVFFFGGRGQTDNDLLYVVLGLAAGSSAQNVVRVHKNKPTLNGDITAEQISTNSINVSETSEEV